MGSRRGAPAGPCRSGGRRRAAPRRGGSTALTREAAVTRRNRRGSLRTSHLRLLWHWPLTSRGPSRLPNHPPCEAAAGSTSFPVPSSAVRGREKGQRGGVACPQSQTSPGAEVWCQAERRHLLSPLPCPCAPSCPHAPSCPRTPSCLRTPSCPILPAHLILPRPAPSCLRTPSCLCTPSCLHTPSCPVLPRPASVPYPALSCPTLPCPAPSCLRAPSCHHTSPQEKPGPNAMTVLGVSRGMRRPPSPAVPFEPGRSRGPERRNDRPPDQRQRTRSEPGPGPAWPPRAALRPPGLGSKQQAGLVPTAPEVQAGVRARPRTDAPSPGSGAPLQAEGTPARGRPLTPVLEGTPTPHPPGAWTRTRSPGAERALSPTKLCGARGTWQTASPVRPGGVTGLSSLLQMGQVRHSGRRTAEQ